MVQRFLEIILGLPSGFLSRQGQLTLQFNPTWPLQQYVGGAAVWNFMLASLALGLVIYVYRREARTRNLRLLLGGLRAGILGLVLLLLNRPVLTLGQERRDPSVMAFLIDDSLSMKVPDAVSADGKPQGRLDAVIDLLAGSEGQLLRRLSSVHDLRVYDFSRGAKQIATIAGSGETKSAATTQSSSEAIDEAISTVQRLKAEGDGTQIVNALTSVLQDVQGQRVAGVVVFTDGRETPSESPPEAIAALRSYGMNIFPVVVGSDQMPRNIAVQSVTFEDTAFVDDYTNLHVTLQASGYEANHPVTLALLRRRRRGGTPSMFRCWTTPGTKLQKRWRPRMESRSTPTCSSSRRRRIFPWRTWLSRPSRSRVNWIRRTIFIRRGSRCWITIFRCYTWMVIRVGIIGI